MLDLLPLILEEGQNTSNQETGPVRPSSDQAHNTSTSAEDVESGDTLESKGSRKSSGILAKYKNFIKGGKRSSRSGSMDEALSGRRSSSAAENLENFAPLQRGESGARCIQSPEPVAWELDGSAANEANPPEPAKFMDRVRAYRNKKSKSKSYDLSSAAGPLAQGMSSGQPEKEAARKGDPEAGLKDFLVDVSEAKELLAAIIEGQRRISKERDKARTLVKASDVQEAQERIRDEIETVTCTCKAVKAKLDALDALIAQIFTDDEEEQLPEHPALQMQLSVITALNAKLAEVTSAWQELQLRWLQEDRQGVAQQLHTVTGREYGPEEVEDMIQSGAAEQLYRQALTSVNGANVQQLMQDVQQRRDQIRELETSLLELHQVFLDLSILVADQGDTINSIDNWVCKTGATMQESLQQLRQAKKHRRRAAQTKAITFVTGVGLVAGGAGLTATGVGAVAGVPMMIAGAAAVGGSAIGGVT